MSETKMPRNSCQLVKISLPGADAIGILYPDREVLLFRGKKAARLVPLKALIAMCKNGGVPRHLSAKYPILKDLADSLNFKARKPCTLKIDVITEAEEAALGNKLGKFAGVSVKCFEEGKVIPAIACRGDIYFRKGDRIICLEDFLDCVRQGYILASRLEPEFDWDGEDDSPTKIKEHSAKKAELKARKVPLAQAEVAAKVETAAKEATREALM